MYAKPKATPSDDPPDIDLSPDLIKPFQYGRQYVRVWAENTGDNKVFIYSYGMEAANGTRYMKKASTYLDQYDDKRFIGYLGFDAPVVPGDYTYNVCVGSMSMDEETEWHDHGIVCPQNITIRTQTLPEKRYIKIENGYTTYSNKVKKLVIPTNDEVRKIAGKSASIYPGKYNLGQIIYLFEYVRFDIKYLSDPRGMDLWATPEQTIKAIAGDCDDKTILLSSLIESIGGTSRIYALDDHLFVAFYSGNDNSTKWIKNELTNFYGEDMYIASLNDSIGNWIVMDPTCSAYVGEPPCDTYVKDGELLFENKSKMYVIDIDPSNFNA